MNTPRDYLRLSGSYSQFLGGLYWSLGDNILLRADGTTFAFNEEIAQFLEGLSGGGSLPHFGHVLHLLQLIRDTAPHDVDSAPEAARLARLFHRAGRSLRNAGAFCAEVCRELPRAIGPVSAQDERYPYLAPEVLGPGGFGLITVEDVCNRLRSGAAPPGSLIVSFHESFGVVEEPPLEPAEFERRVLERTAAYNDDEVLAWFRHGRGPVKGAGETLARELPRRTLEGVLGALLERPRLAGAGGFVAQLVGALTLPPRRLERQELPVGGYSDVTTHGRLDQILPSQFALDELDFLRRLAEQELLYFRREEPPNPARQEMVVVLDQGVRTWGDVRLVLQAAVLALGRQAARRGVPFLVATTAGGGELLDPLTADAETLGQQVEASDLSANPGLALERVLESPADDPRDVVLLTHPRSLGEADVAASARRLGARDRLFALTLDGHGSAELCELRRGAPVRLRQFHVDFTRSAPRPVKPPADSPADRPGPWRGEIEPVGYLFRFGVSGNVRSFVFDRTGQWLLVVAEHGMLHVYRTDRTRTGILPRGMVDGHVLDQVVAAVGVADGFAVAGRVRGQTVVFHYNLASQTCARHLIDDPVVTTPLHYLPEYHTVVSADPALRHGWALDLATGRYHRAEDTIDPAVRAAAAWGRCVSRGLPSKALAVLVERRGTTLLDTHASDPGTPACHVEVETGTVRLYGVPHWIPFTPRGDGQPLLLHCAPLAAQCRGNTLALLTARAGQGTVLRLFRGPEGVPLASYPTDSHHMVYQGADFELSEDGAWLARRVTPARVEVRRVTGDAPPVITVAGGFSGPPAVVLGWCALLISSGRHHAHLLRWKTGTLQTARGRDGSALIADVPELKSYGEPASAEGVPEFLRYDRDRFAVGASWKVTAVADRYGQVCLFTHSGRLVCMFFAFREHLAGWMPDGTRLGPAWLTGAPESPGAVEKFGKALCEACGKGVRS